MQAPGFDTAGSSSSAHGSSGGANTEHAAKARTTEKAVLQAGSGSAPKQTSFGELPCTGLVLGGLLGTEVRMSICFPEVLGRKLCVLSCCLLCY